MTVIGFTTTTSKIKEQSELATAKGLEAFGVSVIEDGEGKHDVIKASNDQLHLFMQMKRGNVQYLLFQEPEHVGILVGNMIGYYGEEKARRILGGLKVVCISGCESELVANGLEASASYQDFDMALSSLA